MKNNLEVVQLLIDKYPSIVDQKSDNGRTGFIEACIWNNLEVVQLLIDKFPSIVDQKNDYNEDTGYDCLSDDSK